MTPTVFGLIILFALSDQVWTYRSFNDFTFTSWEDGDYMIHATLTNLNNSQKFFIEEFVHADSYLRGKISIFSDTLSSVDVHYGSSSQDERLVVQDYDCKLFTYKNKWDQMIPGITSPLINDILLVGPSLIYRLEHRSLVWINGEDTEIRGTMMKSAYAMVGGKILNITNYVKETQDPDYGLAQAARIEFIGNDPSDYTSAILDVYLIKETDDELDKIINPTPGIGCPIKFLGEKTSKDLTQLAKDSVHFISIEQVDGLTQSNTRNEIYASEESQLLHLKTTTRGITTEAIYDYDLGIFYIMQNSGGCLVTPMEMNAPGLKPGDQSNVLKINKLFDIDIGTSYEYQGETWFENRYGFRVDYWESVVHWSTTSSGTYGSKVVTVFFAVQSVNTDSSSGLVPVAKMVYAYNPDSKGSYKLVETVKTYYYDFGQELSNEEYKERFRVQDCYSSPTDRKSFEIQFDCKAKAGTCEDAIKNLSYDFQDKLRKAIVTSGTVSGSRIGDINFELDSNKVTAYVTFLNYPDVTKAVRSSKLYLSKDILEKMRPNIATDAESCLKQNFGITTYYEAIVYCDEERTCYRSDRADNLIEDKQNGISCTVYDTKLEKLFRYGRQSSLANIQKDLQSKGLVFSVYNYSLGYIMDVRFTSTKIDEVQESKSTTRELYRVENYASKFVEDGSNTIMAPNVNNLADCYRACANMDEDDCETFSYCEILDKIECLLSTSVYANVTDKRVYDQNCRIYRKNRLQDYIMIQNREFINPTSVATDYWTDDCADLCSQSDDCFSFQVCDGRCTFGGYYTDSSTKKSSNCQIYIPKLAHKYKTTGKVIVTETFHSEVNLDLDQCAALCYDLDADDGGCASFNYCPKSTASSSCQLSKYSVRDPSSQTIISDVCSNYETFSDEVNNVNKRKQNVNMEQEWKTGTTGKAAFGIIILFMAIGLLGGLIGFYVFDKSKSVISRRSSSSDNTFQWSRHTDVNDEQEQSNV